MGSLKQILKKSPFYAIPAAVLERQRRKRALEEWAEQGHPLPPPQYYKHQVIKTFAKTHDLSVFIETGTFYGDTLYTCRRSFSRLFSVELDRALFEQAVKRFAGNPRITIMQGDSGQVLRQLLAEVSQPALFWLDGHYSEGITAKGELNTPIVSELRTILTHPVKEHVILIDDARCFNGSNDYPTLEELKALAHSLNPALHFHVENDIIAIYP